MDNNNQNRNGGKRPSGQNIGVLALILVITLIAVTVMNNMVRKNQTQELGYEEFVEYLKEGEIDTAKISSNRIYLTPKTSSTKLSRFIQYYTVRIPDVDLAERLLDANGVHVMAEDTSTSASILNFLMGWVLPSALMIGLLYMMYSRMGGGGMMGVGKSRAKAYIQKDTGITFRDVAGQDEAKESLQEVVDFLHNPGKYTTIGAKLPKGALLVGPPGTGKTLLAKAVAGEAHVPFFSLSGSEFVEMFVGVGASRVRDLFEEAKKNAPCIIFIDEIDAIGKSRDSHYGGGNDEREQTLNQLLAEMDGFDTSKGLLILAATNRPEVLDPALLRPGRFDRRIPVELPDLQGREEILKVHAKKIKIADNVDFSAIAKAAAGASGAELANIVNEAALRAVRDGRRFATQADMEESIEVVIAGYQKKNRVLSEKEKLIVSYHEIGHALVAAKQTNSAPVHKITIIPRTSGALGYTMQVEDGEHYLMNKEELENKIATFTGGRAAEELIFHSITTGASNDIEQATKLARGMITRYGMSDEFDMVAMENVSNQYLGGDSSLSCSFETQTLIDKKVVELVKQQHEKALQILQDNIMKLHELAKYLYENETITGEEFMQILERQ